MAEYYIGEIVSAGFNFNPKNFLPCDGRLLAISSNTALFAIIGTIYGGDGRTTFGLPDLRGVTPVGVGVGPGLSFYDLGQLTGSETVTLNTQNMPAHSHRVRVSPAAATSDNPTDRVMAVSSPASNDFAPVSAAGTGVAAMAANIVQPSGSGQPHDNMQPTLIVNYFICVAGIFPPRP